MRRRIEQALSLVLAIGAGYFALQGSSWLLADALQLPAPRGWGPRAGLFPMVIGIPVFALTLVQLAASFRSPGPAAGRSLQEEDPNLHLGLPMLRAIVTIVGFAAAVWLLGFLIAFPAVTLAYLRFAARESWRVSMGMAAAFGAAFYLVFIWALNVRLPAGLLIELLIG